MDIKESIEKTKNGFEKSFEEQKFYSKQTTDQKHLNKILDILDIKDNNTILDLGCGTGFLSFPIAKSNEKAEIIGLDIVEETLKRNSKKAVDDKINNIKFVSYDGIKFPFKDNSIDLIVTRYVAHHFPDIDDKFKEINRVLKKGGKLFISDPMPNDNDDTRFVDEYMKMKKDGHIKFYTINEMKEIAKSANLKYENGFETSITFPKKKNTALEFEDIIKKHSKEIIEGHNVNIVQDEIYITERVFNLLFVKE